MLSLSSQMACAQAQESGFRVFVGSKPLKRDGHRLSYDTHPDDWFLTNVGVPGSAGTTEVGGMLHFAAFGFGYQVCLSDSFSLTLNLGGLAGDERDRH